MTWAEVLSIFNMLTWLLPITVRSYLAWKKPNDSRIILSNQERESISRAISGIDLGSKGLKIGNGNEKLGRAKDGSE